MTQSLYRCPHTVDSRFVGRSTSSCPVGTTATFMPQKVNDVFFKNLNRFENVSIKALITCAAATSPFTEGHIMESLAERLGLTKVSELETKDLQTAKMFLVNEFLDRAD